MTIHWSSVRSTTAPSVACSRALGRGASRARSTWKRCRHQRSNAPGVCTGRVHPTRRPSRARNRCPSRTPPRRLVRSTPSRRAMPVHGPSGVGVRKGCRVRRSRRSRSWPASSPSTASSMAGAQERSACGPHPPRWCARSPTTADWTTRSPVEDDLSPCRSVAAGSGSSTSSARWCRFAAHTGAPSCAPTSPRESGGSG